MIQKKNLKLKLYDQYGLSMKCILFSKTNNSIFIVDAFKYFSRSTQLLRLYSNSLLLSAFPPPPRFVML